VVSQGHLILKRRKTRIDYFDSIHSRIFRKLSHSEFESQSYTILGTAISAAIMRAVSLFALRLGWPASNTRKQCSRKIQHVTQLGRAGFLCEPTI
jgi:hypothetical protein